MQEPLADQVPKLNDGRESYFSMGHPYHPLQSSENMEEEGGGKNVRAKGWRDIQPKSVLWTWHNHYIYELTAAVLFEQDLHKIGSTNGSP